MLLFTKEYFPISVQVFPISLADFRATNYFTYFSHPETVEYCDVELLDGEGWIPCRVSICLITEAFIPNLWLPKSSVQYANELFP
jgi:hypothetical protein